MDDVSKTTGPTLESWRTLAIEQGKIIERLAEALTAIEKLSPKPGGVGQIARDALRV